MGRYDVELKKSIMRGVEKWFWVRREGGPYRTVREAQREATRRNRQGGSDAG